MNYKYGPPSKANIEAVEKRLHMYERALASDTFQYLPSCEVCPTALSGCQACLFSGGASSNPEKMLPCTGRSGKMGATCSNKKQQGVQYRYLIRNLKKMGYDYK